MTWPKTLAEVDFLRQEDFQAEFHRLVFNIIRESGEQASIAVVFSALKDDARHAKTLMETFSYMSEWSFAMPRDVKRLAVALRDRSLVRSLSRLAHSDSAESVEAVLAIQAERRALRDDGGQVDDADPITAIVDRVWAEIEEWQSPEWNWRTRFVMTGISALDRRLGGIKPGLIIVKALRSRGKTAFGVQVANQCLVRNRPVVFVSAEMGAEAILHRFSALRTAVPYHDRSTRKLSDQEIEMIAADIDSLHEAPLTVIYDGNPEVAVLEQRLGEALARITPAVIVVDYLQCVRDSRVETHEREITATANMLGSLAVRHQVPVLLLSQVNERDEARWSREAEDRADVILHIRREWQERRGVVRIEKLRNGEVGEVAFGWDGASGAFTDV